jgi:hypothetical protein
VAEWKTRDLSPWKRQSLTIPPDSWRAWLRLGVWEAWLGLLVFVAATLGARLILSAPDSIITVFDFSNCYAAPVAQPCERVAYRSGLLNVALNFWCGLLLIAAAAWLLWELWAAVAPKPITDDFLKLLDESFSRDWRRPRTWPWARAAWAYGFTLVGVGAAACIALVISRAILSSPTAKAPTVHVETSLRFRSAQ